MADNSHKGPESAANCYAELSLGRAETPEYQLMSFGDSPLRVPAPKPNSSASFMDGPFGGKKPE
jgi:hypothetical protein